MDVDHLSAVDYTDKKVVTAVVKHDLNQSGVSRHEFGGDKINQAGEMVMGILFPEAETTNLKVLAGGLNAGHCQISAHIKQGRGPIGINNDVIFDFDTDSAGKLSNLDLTGIAPTKLKLSGFNAIKADPSGALIKAFNKNMDLIEDGAVREVRVIVEDERIRIEMLTEKGLAAEKARSESGIARKNPEISIEKRGKKLAHIVEVVEEAGQVVIKPDQPEFPSPREKFDAEEEVASIKSEGKQISVNLIDRGKWASGFKPGEKVNNNPYFFRIRKGFSGNLAEILTLMDRLGSDPNLLSQTLKALDGEWEKAEIRQEPSERRGLEIRLKVQDKTKLFQVGILAGNGGFSLGLYGNDPTEAAEIFAKMCQVATAMTNLWLESPAKAENVLFGSVFSHVLSPDSQPPSSPVLSAESAPSPRKSAFQRVAEKGIREEPASVVEQVRELVDQFKREHPEEMVVFRELQLSGVNASVPLAGKATEELHPAELKENQALVYFYGDGGEPDTMLMVGEDQLPLVKSAGGYIALIFSHDANGFSYRGEMSREQLLKSKKAIWERLDSGRFIELTIDGDFLQIKTQDEVLRERGSNLSDCSLASGQTLGKIFADNRGIWPLKQAYSLKSFPQIIIDNGQATIQLPDSSAVRLDVNGRWDYQDGQEKQELKVGDVITFEHWLPFGLQVKEIQGKQVVFEMLAGSQAVNDALLSQERGEKNQRQLTFIHRGDKNSHYYEIEEPIVSGDFASFADFRKAISGAYNNIREKDPQAICDFWLIDLGVGGEISMNLLSNPQPNDLDLLTQLISHQVLSSFRSNPVTEDLFKHYWNTWVDGFNNLDWLNADLYPMNAETAWEEFYKLNGPESEAKLESVRVIVHDRSDLPERVGLSESLEKREPSLSSLFFEPTNYAIEDLKDVLNVWNGKIVGIEGKVRQVISLENESGKQHQWLTITLPDGRIAYYWFDGEQLIRDDVALQSEIASVDGVLDANGDWFYISRESETGLINSQEGNITINHPEIKNQASSIRRTGNSWILDPHGERSYYVLRDGQTIWAQEAGHLREGDQIILGDCPVAFNITEVDKKHLGWKLEMMDELAFNDVLATSTPEPALEKKPKVSWNRFQAGVWTIAAEANLILTPKPETIGFLTATSLAEVEGWFGLLASGTLSIYSFINRSLTVWKDWQGWKEKLSAIKTCLQGESDMNKGLLESALIDLKKFAIVKQATGKQQLRLVGELAKEAWFDAKIIVPILGEDTTTSEWQDYRKNRTDYVYWYYFSGALVGAAPVLAAEAGTILARFIMNPETGWLKQLQSYFIWKTASYLGGKGFLNTLFRLVIRKDSANQKLIKWLVDQGAIEGFKWAMSADLAVRSGIAGAQIMSQLEIVKPEEPVIEVTAAATASPAPTATVTPAILPETVLESATPDAPESPPDTPVPSATSTPIASDTPEPSVTPSPTEIIMPSLSPENDWFDVLGLNNIQYNFDEAHVLTGPTEEIHSFFNKLINQTFIQNLWDNDLFPKVGKWLKIDVDGDNRVDFYVSPKEPGTIYQRIGEGRYNRVWDYDSLNPTVFSYDPLLDNFRETQ